MLLSLGLLPKIHQEFYHHLFEIADKDEDGKIGGNDSYFFKKSGLSTSVLCEVLII